MLAIPRHGNPVFPSPVIVGSCKRSSSSIGSDESREGSYRYGTRPRMEEVGEEALEDRGNSGPEEKDKERVETPRDDADDAAREL